LIVSYIILFFPHLMPMFINVKYAESLTNQNLT